MSPETPGATVPITPACLPERTSSLRCSTAIVGWDVSVCATAVWAPAQVTAKQSAPAATGRAKDCGLMRDLLETASDPGAYGVS